MRDWLVGRLGHERARQAQGLRRAIAERRVARAFDPAALLSTGCELPSMVLIGTHHKTGTVWMSDVFRSIARVHGLSFFRGQWAERPAEVDIFHDVDSRFIVDELTIPYRGLHVIRDPRDVIVSGCNYHKTAVEGWLHEARAEFGGMTYQEKLNGLSSPSDQLLFEMEHVGLATAQAMVSWDDDDASFVTVKYEDLVADSEMVVFHSVFVHLGFPGRVMPSLLNITYQRSLFSGELPARRHINSGRARQWQNHFNQEHRKRFAELYGDALIRLGYEADDAWLEGDDTAGQPG